MKIFHIDRYDRPDSVKNGGLWKFYSGDKTFYWPFKPIDLAAAQMRAAADIAHEEDIRIINEMNRFASTI